MAKNFKESTEPIPFCCEMMKDCVEDDRLYVDYSPKRKGFFTPLAWPNSNVLQFVTYCPWCATKVLPKEFEEE